MSGPNDVLRRVTHFVRGEPLVLFLVLGGAIFAVARKAPVAPTEVHLAARSVRALQRDEARRRDVPQLSPANAAAVEKQAIDDELLYREGLRLGVDRGDTIVRQRVIEKMLFLAEDLAGTSRPVSDDELAPYLAAHAAQFQTPPAVRFIHVFSTTGPDALAKLRDALPVGVDGAAAEPPPVGDAFPIGRRWVDAPQDTLRRNWGADFATAVEALPVGTWSAPLRSAYGYHLVKVLAKREGGAPSLDEVRSQVRIAYLQDRKQRVIAELMRSLHERYRVTIDDRAGAAPLVGPARFSGTAGAD